jgi:hypothetical protein
LVKQNVNGIDHFLSEKILFGIGILGIAIVGIRMLYEKVLCCPHILEEDERL